MKSKPFPGLSTAPSFPRGRESSLLWAPAHAGATVLLVAGLLFAQSAFAMPTASRTTSLGPAELRATLASMPKGDAARGAILHRSHMCASCHGDDGVAPTGNWASLAGQKAAYTYKSLLDYQTGRRLEHGRANLMRVAVQVLSRQDMADLATYLADLPAVAAPVPESSPQTAKAAELLVRRGDPTRLMTPCASCHGARGQGGVNATPALAGQTVGAFTRAMLDYREGRRVSDAHEGMRQFSRRLSLEEIDALAIHYARLGKRREGAQP